MDNSDFEILEVDGNYAIALRSESCPNLVVWDNKLAYVHPDAVIVGTDKIGDLCYIAYDRLSRGGKRKARNGSGYVYAHDERVIKSDALKEPEFVKLLAGACHLFHQMNEMLKACNEAYDKYQAEMGAKWGSRPWTPEDDIQNE